MSSPRIFGIGIGLFILVLVWSISLLAFWITKRSKSSISAIGTICLVVSGIFTAVMLSIPRFNDDESNSNDQKDVQMAPSSPYINEDGILPGQPLPATWSYVSMALVFTSHLLALLVASFMIYVKWIVLKITRPKMHSNMPKVAVPSLDIQDEDQKKDQKMD